MKRSFLLLFVLFGFVGISVGQTGMKAIKKAGRLLSTYNLDPTANADKLTQALDLLETGFEDAEVQSSAAAYLTKGEILSTQANSIINEVVLNPAAGEGKDFTVGYKAYEAFTKAHDIAEKKFRKKEALKGLIKLESIIENMGVIAYQNSSWDAAFKSFNSAMDMSDYITAAGEESAVTAEKKQDLLMNALTVGSQEGSGLDITSTVEKAIAMDIQNPAIYQIAYSTFEKIDPDKATMYLEKGIAKFPEDSGLLFAQINKYIAEGKLEALIEKLKAAIAAEPENATVYATLGNVYDQLYVQASDEGNEEKANEYFDGALKYYVEATEIDENSFNSYYGIGALYFNKAAKVGKALNELSSDFSPAGIKKYDAKKAEMTSMYEKSYPYLEAAEKISPDEPLILQALKEYYVRTNNNDKAAEYKQKLESATGGN